MKLIKHCNPEHNIQKGAKLQIGTLYAYHDIENEEIKDGEEGKYTFAYNFPEEIELDRRTANLLFSGQFKFGDDASELAARIPGDFSAKVDSFEMVRFTENGVVIRNSKVQVLRTIPNRLIFCMSLQKEGDPAPFVGYDDRWSIETSFAYKFSENISRLLLDQIHLERFNPEIGKRLSFSGLKNLGQIGRAHV